MALQRMILVHPELWENRQTPPPPVKSKNHSYYKWTQVRLHRDLYYIQKMLKPKVSHDRTFGVQQYDTDGSFTIGKFSFKYNDKHVFLDGKKYKATQGLLELINQSRPDKKAVKFQDRKAYKQTL